MSTPECRAGRSDSGHLFVCPACRAEARLAAAWKAVPRGLAEVPVEPEPRFIRRVVASVRRDRARRARVRMAVAAAAALLFFFCVGTGHETAAPLQAGPEDSYASLFSPNALSGLIPN